MTQLLRWRMTTITIRAMTLTRKKSKGKVYATFLFARSLNRFAVEAYFVSVCKRIKELRWLHARLGTEGRNLQWRLQARWDIYVLFGQLIL